MSDKAVLYILGVGYLCFGILTLMVAVTLHSWWGLIPLGISLLADVASGFCFFLASREARTSKEKPYSPFGRDSRSLAITEEDVEILSRHDKEKDS